MAARPCRRGTTLPTLLSVAFLLLSGCQPHELRPGDTWEYLEVDAAEGQFLVPDPARLGDFSAVWGNSPQEQYRMAGNGIGAAGGAITVVTAKNGKVPVRVRMPAGVPSEPGADWDHVAEASLRISTGRFEVAGPYEISESPWRAAYRVPPGDYRVRVSYGNLSSPRASEFHGEDHYAIELWPAPPAPIRLLRRSDYHHAIGRPPER